MTDTIDYTPPFGPLGRIADRIAIARELGAMLASAETREVAWGAHLAAEHGYYKQPEKKPEENKPE